MPNDLATVTSLRGALERRLQSARTRASEEQAAEVIKVLWGSYPQGGKPEGDTARIYHRQLKALLTGYSVTAIHALVDPFDGVVGSSLWLPSVAEVKKKLEEICGRLQRGIDRDRLELDRLMLAAEDVKITPEEAARRQDMVKKLKATIAQTALAKQTEWEREHGIAWPRANDEDAAKGRLEALERLESEGMR